MANASTRQIASVDRYANALFQLAKEAKVLETVSSELLNLKKILNEDDNLLSMVKNPSISKSNKFNFFNSLSEKIEMSKLAKNFIGVIINKNRINYLMEIINSFEKLMSGLKGEMSATITSAKVLKEEELKHIKDKLKDKFSSEFNINTIVDETLIVAQGFSPKTKKVWRIAIDDPNQSDERKFIKLISLNNTALATSGNYRKYKINKETGKRSVHSINPKTGNSFPTEVLSASVLAETCMIADAYATALMVMPFTDSMALIEGESNLEAYWIIENEDGGVEEIVSSGFPSE